MKDVQKIFKMKSNDCIIVVIDCTSNNSTHQMYSVRHESIIIRPSVIKMIPESVFDFSERLSFSRNKLFRQKKKKKVFLHKRDVGMVFGEARFGVFCCDETNSLE